MALAQIPHSLEPARTSLRLVTLRDMTWCAWAAANRADRAGPDKALAIGVVRGGVGLIRTTNQEEAKKRAE
jgi:hypothetical protein